MRSDEVLKRGGDGEVAEFPAVTRSTMDKPDFIKGGIRLELSDQVGGLFVFRRAGIKVRSQPNGDMDGRLR